MVLTGDGCVKGARYARCGTTHDQVCRERGWGQRLPSRYLGACHTLAPKYLSMVRQEQQQQRQQPGVPDPEVVACQAQISAARSAVLVNTKAPTDIKCTLGMVCMHAIAVRGVFIGSTVPEALFLYTLMLGELWQAKGRGEGGDLHAFVLDTGCRCVQLHGLMGLRSTRVPQGFLQVNVSAY